jgi:hypothetical protein
MIKTKINTTPQPTEYEKSEFRIMNEKLTITKVLNLDPLILRYVQKRIYYNYK